MIGIPESRRTRGARGLKGDEISGVVRGINFGERDGDSNSFASGSVVLNLGELRVLVLSAMLSERERGGTPIRSPPNRSEPASPAIACVTSRTEPKTARCAFM